MQAQSGLNAARWRIERDVLAPVGDGLSLGSNRSGSNRSETRILFAFFCGREPSDFVSTAFRFTWLALAADISEENGRLR